MPEKSEFTYGYALLIGVGRYKDESLSVAATAKDAVDFGRILINPNLCAYPKTQVHVLTNEDATRSNIIEKLNILKDQVQKEENSTVIIFFSGHGWLEGEYYFLPHETVTTRSDGKLQVEVDSALSNKAFLDKVRQIQARRLVILLSTCFAGGAGTALSPDIEHPSRFTPVPPDIIDELSQGSGRVIISSSGPEEQSWIKPRAANSIFGKHLLVGLKGNGVKNVDNKIGILDLFTYLSKAVPMDAQKMGVLQNPEMKTYNMSANFPIAMLLGGRALTIHTQFKQELNDFIKRLPKLKGKLQSILNSFGPYIMPSECDDLKIRLTEDCAQIHQFAILLTQSNDLPLQVIPLRLRLINALEDFNNQVMAIEKNISRFCDDYTVPRKPPLEQLREIRLRLEHLLESRNVVVDEAEKLRSIID